MKSITIHDLDDMLASLLREKAKSEGLSINKTIKKLLAESLGIFPKNRTRMKCRQEPVRMTPAWAPYNMLQLRT